MALPRSIDRSAFTETPSHVFAVGQTVRLRGVIDRVAATVGEVYQIISRLPPVGDSLQYRIRNERETYERVVREDSLEAIRTGSSGERASLADKTFSR